MRKKKVLSQRELEIEKILQSQLPEYTIRANVRLADIIHAGNQFKWMSGYHLDFVICDHQANVIAAVELDDATHDTDDGKRRDENKNRWLEQANIKLIRIRTGQEALQIREQINTTMSPQKSLHEILSTKAATPIQLKRRGWQQDPSKHPPSHPETRPTLKQKMIGMFLVVVTIIAIFWGINFFLQTFLKNMGSHVVAQQQAIQTQNQQRIDAQRMEMQKQQAEQAWKKQQEVEVAQVQRKLEAEQPHYERKLVKGKSPEECSPSGVIDNAAVICMKDHYENVLVKERTEP